jgi:hypothetical protein
LASQILEPIRTGIAKPESERVAFGNDIVQGPFLSHRAVYGDVLAGQSTVPELE